MDADFPDGVPESHALDPHSPYGCSKAAADVYVARLRADLRTARDVTLRQSCIYGPRQFGVRGPGLGRVVRDRGTTRACRSRCTGTASRYGTCSTSTTWSTSTSARPSAPTRSPDAPTTSAAARRARSLCSSCSTASATADVHRAERAARRPEGVRGGHVGARRSSSAGRPRHRSTTGSRSCSHGSTRTSEQRQRRRLA